MDQKTNFENIFRASVLPSLVLRPKGSYFFIVDANDAYLKITGTKLTDILGKRFRDAFPKKSDREYYGSELLMESFNRVMNERSLDKVAPLRYDLPIPGTSEFRECYWRPKNVPVLNEQGEVEYILHSLKEVTEQVFLEKRGLTMQEELVKTRQQYQHFIETNPDGLYSLDIEGNFTSANQGLADILEVGVEEVLQINFIPFCAPEDQELILNHFHRAIKGELTKFEASFISAKGRKMIVQISLVPIYVLGKVMGTYGIAKDITSIKQSEKIIIEKSNFLKASATFISAVLQSGLNQEDMQGALAMVGKAVDVDRVYYFEATHQEAGETFYSQKLEWTNENSSPQMHKAILQNMSEKELYRLIPNLAKDQAFTSVYSELPEGEQKEMFRTVGAKSMLLLPIFLENKLYGLLGFDDCLRERQWNEEEISFLKSLVDNFTGRLEKLAAEEEIKKRDEALRRSNQKFKALVHEGSDLIGILGPEGKYIFMSESTRRILGMPPEEFLGKKAADFIHPEDMEFAREQFLSLKEKKQIKIRPFRFMEKNGGWRWLETTATNLTQDPAVEGVVINCRDVTEIVEQAREIRELNERSLAAITAKNDELKVANQRFKMAMKASNEVIWDWDLIADQLVRGKGFYEIFGYKQEENQHINSFWLPNIKKEDQDRVQKSLKTALENPNRKKWQEDYGFVKANGEIAHVFDRAYILRDNNGKATRMVGSVLDVTAQEEAMKRIKRQNEILKEIAWEQSHVVRAPLARLQGLMQLMELENFEDISRNEIWKNISASAEELDAIIRNIVSKTQDELRA